MGERILPTPEQLRELLRYEPDTGKLFWLRRDESFFKEKRHCSIWNAKYADMEAFTAESAGYKIGRIFDKMHSAHRVIWAIHSGCWPVHCIDHVNGNRRDNRISNLRPATKAQNSMNQPGKPGAKSKLKGVSWFAARRKWKAEIRSNGKKFFLGHFDTEEDAHESYCKAAKEMHGVFARLS